MKLDEYIFRKKVSYVELAEKLGCSRNHLNRVGLGRIKPGIFLAKAIEQITEGEVTSEELLECKKDCDKTD